MFLRIPHMSLRERQKARTVVFMAISALPPEDDMKELRVYVQVPIDPPKEPAMVAISTNPPMRDIIDGFH